jgi:hypothetical protein
MEKTGHAFTKKINNRPPGTDIAGGRKKKVARCSQTPTCNNPISCLKEFVIQRLFTVSV